MATISRTHTPLSMTVSVAILAQVLVVVGLVVADDRLRSHFGSRADGGGGWWWGRRRWWWQDGDAGGVMVVVVMVVAVGAGGGG